MTSSNESSSGVPGKYYDSYTSFVRAQSAQTRSRLLALPWPAEAQTTFERAAQASPEQRCAIEVADAVDFEIFRQAYLDPARLVP